MTRCLSPLLLAAFSVALVATVSAPVPAQAALPVFDPTNYAQNLLTAARTLQQVNNQIRSLQNEATMLTNQAKNLTRIDFPQLQQITQTLQSIDRLMSQASGLDFRVDQIEARARSLFPGAVELSLRTDQRVAEAQSRYETAMAAFRQTMGMQSQVVDNVQGDARMLADIVARSQGAEGALQAQQATNQLLALTAKQQFQLQTLMAAQFRSESVERARQLQASEDARAATRKFLGARQAYTPH